MPDTPTPMRPKRTVRTAKGFDWQLAEPFRLSTEAQQALQDIKECQGRALVRARSYFIG